MGDSRHKSRLEATQPLPVYIASSPEREEAVNLGALWKIVFRHKGVIALVIILCLIAATTYLHFKKPDYRGTAYLLPPSPQSIQALNVSSVGVEYRDIGDFDANKYTPERVYQAFLGNLKSLGLRRDFFDAYNLVDFYLGGKTVKNVNVELIFNERFNERLQVRIDKEDPSFVTISFLDADPESAAQRVNQYIEFANKHTVDQLYNDVSSVIHAEISRIRRQLDIKLRLAEQRRQDSILVLKEALRIAKTLGIADNSGFPKITDRGQLGLAVNTAQVPLYMRGADALETEIAVLESRKSDEAFISGFRDLQEELAFLEGISINRDSLSAVTKDSVARIPYQAVGPKKAQVIIFAAVLGVVAGLGVALVVEALSRPRQ